ncbi:hypothetical protein VT25_15180 [Photobacterium leiognathi subsp. mandapamensis]|nr:hypothetical protein VT25_15180 [Photobacterium leiognathi subsp. mandapamensis]
MPKTLLKSSFTLLSCTLLLTTSTVFAAGINDINRAVENSRHLEPGETFTLDQPCKLFNNYEHKIYHCTGMIGPLSLLKDKTLAATSTSDDLLYRDIAFVRKEDGQPVFQLLPKALNKPKSQTVPSEQSAKQQLSHVGFLAK